MVGFQVPRREPMYLGGVRISPYLNVFTSIEFEPLGGDIAVAVPDFGQRADEIAGCAGVMRAQGWQVNCLSRARRVGRRIGFRCACGWPGHG